MPRYDYRCTGCGHEFELVQSFREAGSGTCPVCEGAGRRLFHAVPVIYKGSGFYTTDYGRPKRPPENGGKETKETKETKESKAAAGDGASSSQDGKATSGDGPSDSSPSKSASPAKSGSETTGAT